MTVAILRITRFTIAPSDVAEMLNRRSVLIAQARRTVPGLLATCLARSDTNTWVDIWRWDSLASSRRALAELPLTPEATRAFELLVSPTGESLEIIDEH
jgi:hypothetical protein